MQSDKHASCNNRSFSRKLTRDQWANGTVLCHWYYNNFNGRAFWIKGNLLSANLPQTGYEFVSCTLQKCGQTCIKFTSSIHSTFQAYMPQTVLKAAKITQIEWQFVLPQWLCSLTKETQLKFASNLSQTCVKFASYTFQTWSNPLIGCAIKGARWHNYMSLMGAQWHCPQKLRC